MIARRWGLLCLAAFVVTLTIVTRLSSYEKDSSFINQPFVIYAKDQASAVGVIMNPPNRLEIRLQDDRIRIDRTDPERNSFSKYRVSVDAGKITITDISFHVSEKDIQSDWHSVAGVTEAGGRTSVMLDTDSRLAHVKEMYEIAGNVVEKHYYHVTEWINMALVIIVFLLLYASGKIIIITRRFLQKRRAGPAEQ